MTRPTQEIDAEIRRAWTLPSRFYGDAATHAEVLERVFARSWQIVARDEDVRTPQQVHPCSFLDGSIDEPLLLTRDGEDRLHCLSNVCTHRGSLVAASPCRASQLRCPYHGRRFSLDGRFQSMPSFESAENFPSPSDDLPRFPAGRWGPFHFASLDPAEPFDSMIAPMRERMSWLPLDEFRFEPSRSRDYLVRANWALYCDNFLEGFHIPFVHASLNDVLDTASYDTELHSRSVLQVGVAKGGEDSFELPRDHPDAGRPIAAFWWWLFPNLMFNFYPWGLSLNIVRPLAVDRTRVSFQSWVWRPERLDSGAGAEIDRVEREDEQIVELVQRGVRSRRYDRGRYSPTREQGVWHFHRLLAGALA
ncbi:MAG: aromatic ring-hydroxylating dioxygenase subunit alpha [Phycisphaerae bacterium]|nr:aromatic ring-hydroxylating dioxygenase subunit alpha [Phycisphaerae bacterium]